MQDKACGLDCFHADFLRNAPPEYHRLYFDLLLQCIRVSDFPSTWSTVVAVLIPKKEPNPTWGKSRFREIFFEICPPS